MKDNFENIFKDKRSEFDFAEPNIGHFNRFEAKLKAGNGSKMVKKTPLYWLAIAASFLLLFGYWLGNYNNNKGLELADVSPKMEETQNFYLATIHKEIEQIQSEKTPENQRIIEDAFIQLENLEKNYQQLTLELKESNEDKRVVYAMIANFQKRLEVLQNLVDQLEVIKNYEKLVPEENKV
jgi:septal ring factor EnvC (AmiA/AmiB activator)